MLTIFTELPKIFISSSSVRFGVKIRAYYWSVRVRTHGFLLLPVT